MLKFSKDVKFVDFTVSLLKNSGLRKQCIQLDQQKFLQNMSPLKISM